MADLRTQPLDIASANDRLPTLCDKLGYRFNDEALLVRALTHRSASRQHNERLEFLGDAVLGYVIGEYLHRTRRGHREDSLTLLRASLVKRDTLVEVARAIQLGEHLILGVGELRSGAGQRASVLADALEAVVGAIHEDGGIEAARAAIMHLFQGHLENLAERAAKDAKTELQERLQAQGFALPVYRVVDTEGLHHERVFNIACELVDLDVSVTATGTSRKEAEKRAAALMIVEIEDRDL